MHLIECNLWFCESGYLPSLGFKRTLRVKFLLVESVKCTCTLIPSPSSLSRTGEKRMEHCLSCSRSARADLWSTLLLRVHWQPRCKRQTPMRAALALELSNSTTLSTVFRGRIFMKWFVKFTTASTWLQMPEEEKGENSTTRVESGNVGCVAPSPCHPKLRCPTQSYVSQKYCWERRKLIQVSSFNFPSYMLF